MSTTYRTYMRKKKVKYEVGIHYFITHDTDVDSGDIPIGVYPKKEADKVYKIIDKVLELTEVRTSLRVG